MGRWRLLPRKRMGEEKEEHEEELEELKEAFELLKE